MVNAEIASYIEKQKKPFKVGLPTITVFDSHLELRFFLLKNEIAVPSTVLDKCTLTDHFGRIYQSEGAFLPSGQYSHAATASIPVDSKVYLADSVFTLQFLTVMGLKVKFRFSCKSHIAPKCQYLDAVIEQMTPADEGRFMEVKGQKSESKPQSEPESAADSSEEEHCYYDGLESFRRIVQQEMYFLKNNGGHKHKITDGQFISYLGSEFAYSFETETEMHFSDNAPINLTYNGETVQGRVLDSDGFDMILILEKNIGLSISSAYITAEPWKLLKALSNRLLNITPLDTIACKLLREGPRLRTKDSVSGIPKGQAAAAAHVKENDITIIWGPPGTGKTHTMSELAISFLKQNKTVMIVSHSNISVDGVVLKIEELMQEKKLIQLLQEGKVLRYGYVRDLELTKKRNVVSYNYALSKSPSVKTELDYWNEELKKNSGQSQVCKENQVKILKKIKSLQMVIKAEEKAYVQKAKIVATTVSKLYSDSLFDHRKYDVVMFDEVSMAYVPQIISAASYAKEKLICVGDFRQLAPISQSEAKQSLSRDIFSFLGISDGDDHIYAHPWLVMLNEQRRMHPSISAFVNHVIYKSLLKDYTGMTEARQPIADKGPFPGKAMNFVDLTGLYCATTKNSDNSRFNILSAAISFATAQTALEKGEDNIGIITPYAAQTRLIRAMIRDRYKDNRITCATVHQFQGSERNLIIFDAVESYPSTKPGWLMSKNDNGSVTRLVNVAVTRARGKLITVANRGYWKNKFQGSQHTFYKLVEWLLNKENVTGIHEQKLQKYLASLSWGNTMQFYIHQDSALESIIKDIRAATRKIVVSIPTAEGFGSREQNLLKALLEARENGISLMVKTNDTQHLPEEWNSYTIESENAVFPVICIDDKIIWYGCPLADGIFYDGKSGYKTMCQLAVRFRGEHTVDLIRSLSELDMKKVNGFTAEMREKGAAVCHYNLNGLNQYIAHTQKCLRCGGTMELTHNHKKTSYLKCSKCEEVQYLTPQIMNDYIQHYGVKCPKCDGQLKGKLSKFGPYVWCTGGHSLKPEDI